MEELIAKTPKDCVCILENILDNDPLTNATKLDIRIVIRCLNSIGSFDPDKRYKFIKQMYYNGDIDTITYRELCKELAVNTARI